MTALTGSMTRRVMTALTLRVTLSRVMMSCDGTSMASWRRLTRTMVSTGRKTRMMPGPEASWRTRPRRKTTARSYSLRILMELRRYSRMMATAMRYGIMGQQLSGWGEFSSRDDCKWNRWTDVDCSLWVSCAGRFAAFSSSEWAAPLPLLMHDLRNKALSPALVL